MLPLLSPVVMEPSVYLASVLHLRGVEEVLQLNTSYLFIELEGFECFCINLNFHEKVKTNQMRSK